MEKFKAVEKEMKTKAFSKEGLSAAAKLDPKEKEKLEVAQFLSDMVDELGRQIESQEAEAEALQATLKKGKKDSGKADRMAELERTVERHKWHTGKLEVLLRSLENGSVEVEQVKEIDDGIKYYVEQNQEVDFMEDDTIYDDLSLDDEEDQFGTVNENDKLSSQDTQSVQDDQPEHDTVRTTSAPVAKTKSTSVSETNVARRPSVQLKSPLPALSTLHASLPSNVNGKAAETMRPAPLPTLPTGQHLKYSSAAAAAASSVGIAPLPPPPGGAKSSNTASPAPAPAQPVAASPVPAADPPEQQPRQRISTPKEEPKVVEVVPSQASKTPPVKSSTPAVKSQISPQPESTAKSRQPPSPDSGIAGIALSHTTTAQEEEEEESIYHLPSSLADLLGSFEETKQRARSDQPFDLNMLNASRMTCPTPLDAEKPNHYKPQNPYLYTPAHYPQEPLGIFDDPRLYTRMDTDSLFYAFYYRQGTYQQYLAAKALKGQSWRFHKQYQTWFQRHEEPKNITEEFEQGTYRFFDYESTW